MKKIFAIVLAMSLAALLSAQDFTFGIGARGSFGFGSGSMLTGNIWDDASVQPLKSHIAGGALVGRINFDYGWGLFVQPEIGFYHNQVAWKVEDSEILFSGKYDYEFEGTYSYSSIDVPIIIGDDIEVGLSMLISPYIGINLSFPVGSINASFDSGTMTHNTNGVSVTESYKPDSSASMDGKFGVIPGVLMGCSVGYEFDSHNALMGDLRFLTDFTQIKGEYKIGGSTEEIKVLTRRGLSLGISYIYLF